MGNGDHAPRDAAAAFSVGASRLARSARATAAGKWLRSGTGLVGAGVSLTAGILTLLFLVRPSLQPQGPSQAFAASLSAPRIERGVTLGEVYTRRQMSVPADLSPAQRAQSGALVGVDVVLQGYKNTTCTLTWTVLDQSTMSRVPESWLIAQPGVPDGRFTADAARDQASGEVWVNLPARPGSFVVRFELRDPGGTLLTSLDTEPVAVAGSAAPALPTTVPVSSLPTPAAP